MSLLGGIYNRAVLPYHWGRAVLAGMRFRFPAKGLRVIGVTGTNGKTTTSYMIWKMLSEAGIKTGLLTTVGWGVDRIHEHKEHVTTLGREELNRRIIDMKKKGIEVLVLETTSHALSQFRTLGIPIEVAVITNLTHEHLDYHGTFERYAKAKAKLFKGAKYGIVNADDSNAKYFMKAEKTLTYGIKKGGLRAEKVKLGGAGVEYEVEGMKIQTRISGEFNVYNSLAAVAVGKYFDLSDKKIEQGIYALDEVEGRMNSIDEGQDFAAIVDFAHTPDSFEKLLPDMRAVTKGRLIVLFGSAGGRRDPSKRAPQGELAGKYADVIILTEEDDRDTPAEEIFADIETGITKTKFTKRNLYKIVNRPKAVDFAVEMARRNDVVLFLGKGHERTIEREEGDVKYYEADEVRRALKKRFASGSKPANKK